MHSTAPRRLVVSSSLRRTIKPYFLTGSSTPLLINEDIVKYLLDGGEGRLYAAFPGWMSSDVLYLAARIRKARADGTLDR
jgi:hypothetical protein